MEPDASDRSSGQSDSTISYTDNLCLSGIGRNQAGLLEESGSRLEPENGRIWMDLALCQQRIGRLDQARKSYLKSLGLGIPSNKALAEKLDLP